jgi:hypothetical protein
MYFNPNTISVPNIAAQSATLDAVSAALLSHAKATLAVPSNHPLPLSRRNHQRLTDAFHTSSSFDFEPFQLGVADDGDAIVGAFVTGYATVTDAGLQRQLAALGRTCSIWYKVGGDMAEADNGATGTIRMVEDTISVALEVF